MKIIEISRSFSKKVQEKQYEPYEVFASYKAEVTEKEAGDVAMLSNKLFKLAVDDVGVALRERYFEKWTNPAKAVKGISEGKDYNEPNIIADVELQNGN